MSYRCHDRQRLTIGASLFSLENVVLSPHTAASTRQAMRRMGLDAARGILDILGGADALSPPAGAPWQTVNPSFADAGEREGGAAGPNAPNL